MVILAISLGVGLGVGLTRAKGSSNSDVAAPGAGNTSSSNSSQPVPSPNGTEPSGTGSNGTEPNGTGAIASTVINDTSLAALETSDGNRHFFYQHANSSVQYAVFSNNKWSTSSNQININDARNNTPLAAVVSDDGAVSLCLVHVNQIDRLNRPDPSLLYNAKQFRDIC